MRLLHKRGTDGIKNSQKMKSAFFDCFYVMYPLFQGQYYKRVQNTGHFLLFSGPIVIFVCRSGKNISVIMLDLENGRIYVLVRIYVTQTEFHTLSYIITINFFYLQNYIIKTF